MNILNNIWFKLTNTTQGTFIMRSHQLLGQLTCSYNTVNCLYVHPWLFFFCQKRDFDSGQRVLSRLSSAIDSFLFYQTIEDKRRNNPDDIYPLY